MNLVWSLLFIWQNFVSYCGTVQGVVGLRQTLGATTSPTRQRLCGGLRQKKPSTTWRRTPVDAARRRVRHHAVLTGRRGPSSESAGTAPADLDSELPTKRMSSCALEGIQSMNGRDRAVCHLPVVPIVTRVKMMARAPPILVPTPITLAIPHCHTQAPAHVQLPREVPRHYQEAGEQAELTDRTRVAERINYTSKQASLKDAGSNPVLENPGRPAHECPVCTKTFTRRGDMG